MRKKVMILFLCLSLLLSIPLPVFAEEPEIPANELSISTAEEFLTFAENCRLDRYSQGLIVILETDIDLSGSVFAPIPIFSGTFDGKGHTVSGIAITAEGTAQGLFRYLTATAVVRDLHIKGDIHPGGSRSLVGAIAGQNQGQILRCSFEGQLSGGDQVGGIAGFNTVTGIIESCRVAGTVHGDHFVGGTAGKNAGVIRSCSNKAQINTTPQQNSISISDITMDTLTNAEAANTVTDIGGIAGISSGVIRECKNSGDVGYRHMGYNIGGIAGTQSGHIVGCENRGNIQGRKEVGGIVGQMEPAALIEYSQDTLQLLQGQLNDLSGLVDRASGNAQANASQVSGQIGLLQEQTQAAQDAVDILFPDQENSEIPDPDTLLAAQNALTDALSAMPGTLRSIATATQTAVNALGRDLGAISAQVGAMGSTMNDASEKLGGSIQDVSDLDTPEALTGKVASCANFGNVLADLNVGGIAGAVAMENDLDILEDWQQQGEESLRFESKLRAVLLNCDNFGTVTGKKQNAGGIVGWQALGLVRSCTNTGNIAGESADYVGGIAGMSTGYIRSNYAKCDVAGKSYAGGIAGSGTVVTDCISMVQFLGGSEKLGAILGVATQSNAQEQEAPIWGNLYPVFRGDMGAIDGISYAGVAEGLPMDSFLALEALPELFSNVTVRFVYADGSEKQIEVPTGSSILSGRLPTLPEKEGFTAKWEGLDSSILSSIICDMTFEAVYIPHRSTIQCQQVRENGLPVVLAEGAFIEEATVSAQKSSVVPEAANATVEGWTVYTPEGTEAIRILLPEAEGIRLWQLLIQGEDGAWSQMEFTQKESYLVFPAAAGELRLALVGVRDYSPVWRLAGISAAAAIFIAIALIVRKISKKQTKTKA